MSTTPGLWRRRAADAIGSIIPTAGITITAALGSATAWLLPAVAACAATAWILLVPVGRQLVAPRRQRGQ